jgi:hypothetical protein
MNEASPEHTSSSVPATEPSIARLIRLAEETTIPWIVEGLWQEGGIAIVHSLEEEFKSVFSYQIAEAVASGLPLLRTFKVPKGRRVGIFETEMDDLEVGKRLSRMYPRRDFPEKLIVSDGELIKEFRRETTLQTKMERVGKWIRQNGIEVLVWDTINSVLAATDPNSEVGVSRFFDRLALLPLQAALLVRHDGKPSKDSANRSSNQLVRGSNRLVEDASLVIHLQRQDKAQNKVRWEVGKLRNAPKPEPIELWFDIKTFRLTPLHPVAALLESGPKARGELIEQANARFGLKQRAVDAAISELRSLLYEEREGHKRVFKLNANPPDDSSFPWPPWWSLLQHIKALP